MTQIYFRIKGANGYHNFQTDQLTRDIVAEINAKALHVTPLMTYKNSKHNKFNYLCALRVKYKNCYEIYGVKSYVSNRNIGEISIFLEEKPKGLDIAYTTCYEFLGVPIKYYCRKCLEMLLIMGIEWRKVYNGYLPINPNDNNLLNI